MVGEWLAEGRRCNEEGNALGKDVMPTAHKRIRIDGTGMVVGWSVENCA